jgi:ATP-dependent protease ClpP protease subunit
MAEEKEVEWKLDHTLKVKPEDLTGHIHNHDVDLKSNHIYLFGAETYATFAESTAEPGVEYVLTNRFIRNLNLCMRVNPGSPILIHMKTCGGDEVEGLAVYDVIRACPSPVTILNYTHARSMSSIIFQAANKRVMMEHSYFMFHMGTMEVGGTVKSTESYVEFGKRYKAYMLNIYTTSLKKKGKFKDKTEQQIKRWLREQMDRKEEVFLTASQAVEYGFADEVFNYDWASLTDYTDEQLTR